MPLIEDLGKGTLTGPNRFFSYSSRPSNSLASHQPASGGSSASTPGQGGGGGRTKRTSTHTNRVFDNATRQRAIVKRVAELEKENYNEQAARHFEIPNLDALIDTSIVQNSLLASSAAAAAADGNSAVTVLKNKRRSFIRTQTSKSGSTPNTRKILASRKTLLNLEDDDPASARDVVEVLSVPPRYPVKHLCGICGSGGKYLCPRCGLRYCSLNCDETHKETRCIKMYA